MRFCPEHWAALQAAIDQRGLSSLIADSGEKAASNLVNETEVGTTIDNFDPLMGAHNAIVAQAMSLVRDRYQQNPLMIMADASDASVTWPTCPICALNWCHAEHDRLCEKPGCDYPKAFDWTSELIDGAADHMLSLWRDLASDNA